MRFQAELTASDRVGLHRYRYAAGEEAKIMLGSAE